MSFSKFQYIETYIDSRDYSSGSLNKPTIIFQNVIPDVVAFSLISAEVPFTWNVVDTGSNSFTYTDSAGSGSVTIQSGNYDPTTYAAALQTALAGRSPAPAGGSVAVSASSTGPNLYKLTFTSTSTSAPVITYSSYNTAQEMMGFAPDTLTATFTGTSGNYTRTSTNTINLTGENYIYLRSNLGSLIHGSVRTSNAADGSVVAKIPVNVNPGHIIEYVDEVPEGFYMFSPTNLNRMEFYVTRPRSDTPLDLNGMSFTLKIGLLKLR